MEVASHLSEALVEVPGCPLWVEEGEEGPCLLHQEEPGHLLGKAVGTASGQEGGL